jgi:ubiquinone/menaquinone biosynthesis C-methylase UbiE
MLQMEFMRSRGLQPSQFLLDVGCGCLRGGIHFVRYLEAGRYVGIDANRSLLQAGLDELEQAGLGNKGAVLIESAHFEFQKANMLFDSAIAISVFTHVFMNHIARCLAEVKRVLKNGASFYATYFEAPAPIFLESLVHQPGGTTTHYDRDPFHLSNDELASLAVAAGLTFHRIGDWGHPRGQMMAAFTRN